jgi:hypothetical protein
MKLTKTQLREIIKEEIQSLNETENNKKNIDLSHEWGVVYDFQRQYRQLVHTFDDKDDAENYKKEMTQKIPFRLRSVPIGGLAVKYIVLPLYLLSPELRSKSKNYTHIK